MAQNQGESVVEGLKKMLGQLPGLLTLPDADEEASQFVQGLTQAIVGYIKQKQQKAAGLAQGMAQQAAGIMGGPQPSMQPGQGMGAGPSATPGAAQFGPGGASGGGSVGLTPQLTDPDELRRMLAGSAGPGGAQ